MYEQSLEQAGLTKDQALIYEALLKNGSLKAGKIHQKTPLKRGLVYKLLEDLVKIGLVEKKEDTGKVAVFSPAHPLKLRDLAKGREQKARDAQLAIDGVLGQLSSDYNLTIGKPGVEFFEGKDGLIRMYEEVLRTREPIDSIEDKGEMAQLIGDYTKKFIQKRVSLKLWNRVIAPAENKINVDDENELRKTRFIPTREFPFRMDIKITGARVALATLQKEHPVGVLMDNSEIADNFRLLFEYLWKKLTPLAQDLPPARPSAALTPPPPSAP